MMIMNTNHFSNETTDDRMDDYQYKPLSPFSNETSDADDCECNPSSPFSDTSSNSSLAPSRKLCRHPDVWPDSAFNVDGKPISSVFKNFYRLTPVKCDKRIPFDIDGLEESMSCLLQRIVLKFMV